MPRSGILGKRDEGDVRLRTTVPVLVTVVVLAAGCSSQAVEPPGLTATPTPSASSSPSATADADPALEPSDPELGIVFEDVPQLSGAEVDVYNAAAAYQKEYWRMMTTNTVGPGFDVLASPEVKAMMQRIATQNTGLELVIRGVLRTRISGVVVEGQSATVAVCDDYREVTASDPNGTYTSQEVGLVNTAKQLVVASLGGGVWMVRDSVPAGTC